MILLEHFPQGLRKRVQAYADQQIEYLQNQLLEERERAEREKEEAIKKTAQIVLEIAYSVALLACIEDLDFSPDPRYRNGKPPRLQRLITGMEKQLSYFGRVFGLEMLDGVREHLLSYNVKLEEPKVD
jgi:hypothetical protein